MCLTRSYTWFVCSLQFAPCPITGGPLSWTTRGRRESREGRDVTPDLPDRSVWQQKAYKKLLNMAIEIVSFPIYSYGDFYH